jgi:hypothetical protein
VALEFARRVTHLLASHVATSTNDIANVDSIVSLPAALGNLALLSNGAIVYGNDSARGTISGWNISSAKIKPLALCE